MGSAYSRVTHNLCLRHMANEPTCQFHIAEILLFSFNQYLYRQG